MLLFILQLRAGKLLLIEFSLYHVIFARFVGFTQFVVYTFMKLHGRGQSNERDGKLFL